MRRKFRFYYWFIRGLVERHKLLVIVLLVACIGFFYFWGSIWDGLVVQGYKRVFGKFERQYYTEAVIGTPKVINPLFASTDLEKDIDELVFQGLFNVTSSGQLQPELIEDYTVKSDKEYIINLKKTIHWHEGKPFTGRDVLYTIGLAKNPEYKSRYYDVLKDVTVEKITDYSLKFTLKEPFAPFLTTLDFGIIPEHIPLSRYLPVGTGVFKVKRSDKKQIVLTKDWLDLTFKFYPDYATALTALKLGEVQGLGGLLPGDAEELKKWPNFKVYSQPMYRRYVAMYFNMKSSELGDKGIRQVLRSAVPKDTLVQEVTKGFGAKAFGPIQPTSWAFRDLIDPPYNLETSATQLTKLGWVKKNTSWEKNGKALSVSISYPNSPLLAESADIISRSWRSLGIQVEEKPYDPLHFKEQVIIPKNFEVVLSSQETTPDPDQYVLWHSTQILNGNIAAYTSEKADKMLEDGRKLRKQEDRKEKYVNFQKYLYDDVPAVFLYYPPYNYVVSSRIKDLKFTNFNVPSNRFNNALDWKIESRVY